MKRLIAFSVATILAISMVSCGVSENSEAEAAIETQPQIHPIEVPLPQQTSASVEALASLRGVLADTGNACAVAALGRFTGEFEALEQYLYHKGFLEAYPFLEGIPREQYVEAGGEELYLIVPADPEQGLCVYDWVMDESNGYYGEIGEQVFYQNEAGDPILLRCNVSDIMPNAVIVIGGLEYCPSLSLMDGSLVVPGVHEPGLGVMDITVDGATAGAMELPEDGNLERIRDYLWYNEYYCGVAFLGWWGSDYEMLPDFFRERGYDLRWPFIMEIPEELFAQGAGEELYLVIPRDPNSKIQVTQGDGIFVEDVLYMTENGDPFLVQGNMGSFIAEAPEEVIHNLTITMEESSGDVMIYSPGLNYYTGELAWNYQTADLNPIPIEEKESASIDSVTGCWNGYVSDSAQTYYVYFEFKEDGTAYYGYGPDYTACFYEGTWSKTEMSQAGFPLSGYVLDLELSSGKSGTPASIENTVLYISKRWEEDLVIQWISEDPLIPEFETEEFWVYFLGEESKG